MFLESRKKFPELLTARGLNNVGVEVGVYRGDFAHHLLNKWACKKLYLVDPWLHQPDLKLDRSNVAQEDHDDAYRTCKSVMEQYHKGRYEIIRKFSTEAAKLFEDNSLDFVYIDAQHQYRNVYKDLQSWYSKVKRGGILAGHDYFNGCVRKNLVEVKRAVDDFFWGKDYIFSTQEKTLRSWFVIVGEYTEKFS